MSKIPTLEEIVQAVDALALRKRKRAPQGRKPKYADNFIIALTVYQKLAGFRYAQQMLAVLRSLGQPVPAPSTFAERKAGLMGPLILAVKRLCAQGRATKQHLDSKKLEVVDSARAKRTKLAGHHGYDHTHQTRFYGFRLHAQVDDQGSLCEVLLRSANEHDVKVAPRLLGTLSYTIVTADKGYLSKDLKTELARRAVDLVTPRRRNQLPPPRREQRLYKGHRIVETTFSLLDRLGLSERPYRSTKGFVLHVYSTLLAYSLKCLKALRLHLFRIGLLLHEYMSFYKCTFPPWHHNLRSFIRQQASPPLDH